MRLMRIGLPAALLLMTCVVDTAPLAGAQGGRPAGTVAERPALVNINTATVQELQQIKGIGPAIARRIVEYRQKSGPFQKVEEIMNVRGIGEKTFLKFKHRITVGEPAARNN